MLSNVAYRLPLHHHPHLPRCLARHPQTTSNLMWRPSLSLTLLTNSIQRRSSNLIVTHWTWCPTFRQLPLSLTLLTNSIQRHSSNLIVTHRTWCPTFHQPPLSLTLLTNSIQRRSSYLIVTHS